MAEQHAKLLAGGNMSVGAQNATKTPTARLRVQRQPKVIAVPQPVYHETFLTMLVPKPIKEYVRNQTEGEHRALVHGMQATTVLMTLGWAIFITLH